MSQIAKDVTSTILSDPQGKCEDILKLSYNHLPEHLKSCLLYLGVFPEDHEISVTRLVNLWVVEGLVREGTISAECVEDVGKRYVYDLINRSLVIHIKENSEGGVKSFQLHDLLRDFCLKKAKEENFFTVLDDRSVFDLSLSPRRISINNGMEKHLPFISLSSVRTMMSFGKSSCTDDELERIMKSEHIILLNVLDMHELEGSAFYLDLFVHLRYLAILKIHRSDQFLEHLSLSKLWNLEVLILSFFDYNVVEVPNFIWDMVKLRHIHLHHSALFPRQDSKRIEGSPVLLENLKLLSKPILNYSDSNWLSKLPGLQKLSCLFFYSFDNRVQRTGFPELKLCNQLTSLKVQTSVDVYQNQWPKLQLPRSLKKLSLSNFKLESDAISELGQSLPNLVVLKLHDSFINWSVNCEDFPALKVLKISGWYCKEWDASEESFPRLEQLWLERFNSLGVIPFRFGDIHSLRLISMKYCNLSVYESGREVEKIQLEAQNQELKVNIEPVSKY